MSDYKIFLADDHEILRAGLKSLIDKEPNLKVVGQAKDGEELIAQLKSTKCDVVVVDLSMPNVDGLEAIGQIREKYPKTKILVLTMQKDEEHFKRAMKNGALGYLLKDEAFDQLILAIRTVLKGKRFVSPGLSAVLTDQYVRSLDQAESSSLEILTNRERQILKLVANGLPNKNIASKLKISIRTVETHRMNLAKKLGLRNTAALVKYAMRKGLV